MRDELNILCFLQQKQFEYRFEKMFLASSIIIGTKLQNNYEGRFSMSVR